MPTYPPSIHSVIMINFLGLGVQTQGAESPSGPVMRIKFFMHHPLVPDVYTSWVPREQ